MDLIRAVVTLKDIAFQEDRTIYERMRAIYHLYLVLLQLEGVFKRNIAITNKKKIEYNNIINVIRYYLTRFNSSFSEMVTFNINNQLASIVTIKEKNEKEIIETITTEIVLLSIKLVEYFERHIDFKIQSEKKMIIKCFDHFQYYYSNTKIIDIEKKINDLELDLEELSNYSYPHNLEDFVLSDEDVVELNKDIKRLERRCNKLCKKPKSGDINKDEHDNEMYISLLSEISFKEDLIKNRISKEECDQELNKYNLLISEKEKELEINRNKRLEIVEGYIKRNNTKVFFRDSTSERRFYNLLKVPAFLDAWVSLNTNDELSKKMNGEEIFKSVTSTKELLLKKFALFRSNRKINCEIFKSVACSEFSSKRFNQFQHIVFCKTKHIREDSIPIQEIMELFHIK